MTTFQWTKSFLLNSVPEQYKDRLLNDYEEWKNQTPIVNSENYFSLWMNDKPRPYLYAVQDVLNPLSEIHEAEIRQCR